MIRIGKRAAWGLLVAGPGCAGLQRAPMPQAPHDPPEIAEIARAEPTEPPRPIDPFHPPAEPASTRMARFFPGLARFERSNSPVVESLRQGGKARAARDRDLEAVPRPDAAPVQDETTTAALPRRGLRLRRRVDSSPAPDAGTKVTSVARRRPEVVRPRPVEPEVPVLAAAVVAEIDPADVARPSDRPAKGIAAKDEALIASAALSPRRSPPLPDVNPSARRPLPPRMDVADRREEVAREDDQARRARGGEDLHPAAEVVQPLLAVAEDRPRDEPPAPEASEDAANADRPRRAEAAPAEAALEARPVESEGDGPPPIDTPSPRRDRVGNLGPVDPDTGGDPVLAGRPRMPRPGALRDELMPDVPPVSFPRTYYGRDTIADEARAPRAPAIEEATARWTWRPRLIQRLRGQ